MTTTGARSPAAPGASVLRSRRAVLSGLAGTAVLAAAYASFMVPLLAGGLAEAPMVTVRDASDDTWQFSVPAVEALPAPLPALVDLLWLATITLGPLVAAVGTAAGGALAVAEARDRRWWRAAAWALTGAACTAVLVLALSPWGRTATAWFFD